MACQGAATVREARFPLQRNGAPGLDRNGSPGEPSGGAGLRDCVAPALDRKPMKILKSLIVPGEKEIFLLGRFTNQTVEWPSAVNSIR